jgi:hypothetical protein
MDKSEKLAREYLSSVGFQDIVYEPDGNIPPDFLVNGKIAVEVRRLNQNERTATGIRGLEETAKPLKKVMVEVLESMGPPTDVSWFVSFSFSRPLRKWKKLKQLLAIRLTEFNNTRPDTPFHVNISDRFRIRLDRAGKLHSTMFVPGGSVDLNSGGFILAEIRENLSICIDEKSKKVAKVRHRYPEWWLLLLDYIGYGLDDDDCQKLRNLFELDGEWDKIILVNPLNIAGSFEL